MTRKTGYLANVINVPPLIFRFQFNPDLMSEKKSYGYREVQNFGKWEFDRTAADTGFGKVFGALDDLKEFGPLLVGTKGLEADTGKPRTFALDFALDARFVDNIPELQPGQQIPGAPPRVPVSGDKRFGGRLEPSLAVLRSFMNPSWDPLGEMLAWLAPGRKFCPPTRPPVCSLKLGGIDLECVMTDLNIKITNFKSDLTPERAEISVTLQEQTQSIGTTLDYIGRHIEVAKSYWQLDGEDWAQTAPGVGLLQNVFGDFGI
ncbi:hypothetical protein AB0H76_17925 [Nocardia sp. NPDC050712]|uniref:hypothetical protein n=1 Tax=Nocardia sp. NPDC050712 TaxID=3155518 RepID=UPI0033E9E293